MVKCDFFKNSDIDVFITHYEKGELFYKGQIKQGLRHGYGTLYSEEGTHEGEFRDD